MRLSVRSMVLCALFAALIAIGAYITIPIPYLPMTLQTFFVMAAGMFLGGKNALIAVVLYAALGLVGLPVFTGGRGGFSSVLMPSFGYVLGMIAAAWLIGRLTQNAKAGFWRMMLAGLAGTAVIYAVGLPYMYMVYRLHLGDDKGISWVLYYGFVTTILPDVFKCAVAALVASRLRPVLWPGGLPVKKPAE